MMKAQLSTKISVCKVTRLIALSWETEGPIVSRQDKVRKTLTQRSVYFAAAYKIQGTIIIAGFEFSVVSASQNSFV
jgi:hypothetical protein